MSITFENLNIEKLIAHEVYKRDISGHIPPFFSNELLDFGTRAKAELCTRIISAMNQNGALEVDIIETGGGSVYDLTLPFFNTNVDDNEFISISKLITQKLSNSQERKNIPGGVVVVFTGSVGRDNKKCVGVIKAEKHAGFMLVNLNEKKRLEYVADLLLTPEQKLYKIAMLIQDNNLNIHSFIFDSNNNITKIKSTADYFRKDFMGCEFQDTSDIATKNFFIATKTFLTKHSGYKGSEITDKISSLYTYMKNEVSNVISVGDFNNQFIADPAIKDNYLNYMKSQNIPINSIHKDLSKISGKLSNRRISFDNNISLLFPDEEFRSNLEIIESTDGYTTIKIKGTIISEI